MNKFIEQQAKDEEDQSYQFQEEDQLRQKHEA
jgi:hypothetical protein